MAQFPQDLEGTDPKSESPLYTLSNCRPHFFIVINAHLKTHIEQIFVFVSFCQDG